MRRSAAVAAVLLASATVRADDGWRANQIAQGHTLNYDPSHPTSVCYLDAAGTFTCTPDLVFVHSTGSLGVQGTPNHDAAIHAKTSSVAAAGIFATNTSAGTAAVSTIRAGIDPTDFSGGANLGINMLGTAYATSGLLTAETGILEYNGPDKLIVSVFQPGQAVFFTSGNSHAAMASIAPTAFTVNYLGGGGTQCLETDNTGKLIATGSACGSGSGTVTTVTGTPPIFITSTPTTTPNVTIQGAIVSGSTSTTAQNLGAISTAPLGCVTSGGVCTVDGLTLSGGLNFNTGTGAETLANFTCGSNTFVSSATTGSGLACTQPAFSNLSGSATCSQLPALTGVVSTSAGSCATSVATDNTSIDISGSNKLERTALSGDAIAPAGSSTVLVVGITDGASADWTTSGHTFVAGQPLVALAGGGLGTNAISSFGRTSSIQYNLGDLSSATWNCSIIPGGSAGAFCNPDGNNTEFGKGFAANFCRITVNVTTNTFATVTSPLTMQVTRNGSNVTGCVTPSIAAGATGVFDSGQISVAGTASSDTWGVHLGSHYASGTASIWVNVEIYQ